MKLKNFRKLLNIKMGIFSKFNAMTLAVLVVLIAISALYINEKRVTYNKLNKQSHFIKKLVINNELKALVHDEFTLSVKYLASDSTEEELKVAQQKVDLNIRRLNVLQNNFITSENHKLIKKWRDQVEAKEIKTSELNDQFKSFEILLSKKHSDIIYSNDMPLNLLHDQVILAKAFDSTLQLNSSFNQESNESISSSHLSAYYTLWSLANDDILIDTTSFQEEMTKLKEYFSHTTYDKYLYSSKGIGFDVYTQLLSSMLVKHLEKVRTLVHVQKTNDLFQIQLVSVLLIMFLMVAIFSLISLRKVSKHFRLKFHDINNFMTIINLISASLTKSSNNTKDANQIQKDNVQFMLDKINEVKGTIKENTDIAKETKVAVSESIVIVGEGKESVELMDKHFNEMGDSSNDLIIVLDEVKEEFSKIQAVIEEISQKTSIINDIVFQTKLLSFNASVEAARAGEHGKGFAVVAEEIGNLAKMSGVASEEISTLTTNSSQLVERIIENMSMKVNDYVVDSKERIERNTSNVKKCVDIFQQIYLTSHNISNKVIDFTMITEEQSEGVREIANCVDGIVEVTEKTFDASLKNLELISRTGNSVNKVMKVLEGLSIIVRGSLIDVHQIKDEKLKSIILSTKKNKSIDDELLELTEKSDEVA